MTEAQAIIRDHRQVKTLVRQRRNLEARAKRLHNRIERLYQRIQLAQECTHVVDGVPLSIEAWAGNGYSTGDVENMVNGRRAHWYLRDATYFESNGRTEMYAARTLKEARELCIQYCVHGPDVKDPYGHWR